MVVGIAISGFTLVVGWFLLYLAVVWRRQRSLIEDTPTSKVRSLALGRVELEGIARAVDDPYETPVSGTPAVLYRYLIEHHYRDGDGNDEWATDESGVEMAPFYLDDGTGQVLVDPAGADLDVRKNVVEVTDGEDDPAQVARFLDERADRFDEHATDGVASMGVATFGPEADGVRVGDASDTVEERPRRRYVEEFLPADEEVYVFGKARERTDGSAAAADVAEAGNVVVGDGDDLPSYTISHRPEAAVVAHARKWVLTAAGFGLVFAVFGFVSLLAAVGPLLGVVLAAVTLGVAYALREVSDRAQFVSSS